MIGTKYIDEKVFDYIYPWIETLTSIAWSIRTSYHRTIGTTTAQCFPGRVVIFNPVPVFDWRVVTAKK